MVFLFLLPFIVTKANNSDNATFLNQQPGLVVSGKVTDPSGDPVPAATIAIKGTTTGTVSDFDGNYTLSNVSADDVLEIRCLGMETQEIPVNGRTLISAVLEYTSVGIDELVVVGYGAQKKVNLTGSVSTVTIDEQLTSRSLPNLSMALQGKVAGLAISQNSGMAGRNDIQMLVRGMGTVNNANPLVVVDGMPGVDINRINMDDIESISV